MGIHFLMSFQLHFSVKNYPQSCLNRLYMFDWYPGTYQSLYFLQEFNHYFKYKKYRPKNQ